MFNMLKKSNNLDPNTLLLNKLRGDWTILKKIPQKDQTPEIAEVAAESNGAALQYIREDLKTESLCLKAVESNGNAYKYTPDFLKTLEFNKKCIYLNNMVIYYMSNSVLTYDLCFDAVSGKGSLITAVPGDLVDKKMCLESLKTDPYIIIDISKIFPSLMDGDIYAFAVKQNNSLFRYVPSDKKTPQMALQAVKGDVNQFNNIPWEFYQHDNGSFDIGFLKKCLKANFMSYKYFPSEVKQNPELLKMLGDYKHKHTKDSFYYSDKNTQYQGMKWKFLNLVEKINSKNAEIIEMKSSGISEESPELMGARKELKVLNTQIKQLKLYSVKNALMTEEEIDGVLLGKDVDTKPLEAKERVWEKGFGQNFTSSKEKVLAIYCSKSLMMKYFMDPLINIFLTNSEYSHFQDENLGYPLGWALVYVKDKKNWVINQVQSDIVSNFRHVLNGLEKKEDSGKITTEELGIQLRSKNRYGYYLYLTGEDNEQNRSLLVKALSNPNLFDELPECSDIEEAGKNIASHQEELSDLMNAGVLSIGNNDGLKNLNREQLRYIEDKMSWLIDNWVNIVFQNVWEKAKKVGVENIYWNSSETVDGGLSDRAKKVFYESYPKNLGFEESVEDLRGKDERFWKRKAFNFYMKKIIAQAQNKELYEFYLQRVKQYGAALQYIPEELMDKEICLEAVKQNGFALKFAEEFIDKEICLEAVRQNGFALEFVPEELMDKEICLEAVRQNYYALIKDIPEEFIDKEICLEAVRQNSHALKYIPKNLQHMRNDILIESIFGDSLYNSISNVDQKYSNYSLLDRVNLLGDRLTLKCYNGCSLESFENGFNKAKALLSPRLKGMEDVEKRKDWGRYSLNGGKAGALDMVFVTTDKEYALKYSKHHASDSLLVTMNIPISNFLEYKILVEQDSKKTIEMINKRMQNPPTKITPHPGEEEHWYKYYNEGNWEMLLNEKPNNISDLYYDLFEIGTVELTLMRSIQNRWIEKVENLSTGEDLTRSVRAFNLGRKKIGFNLFKEYR